MFLCLFSYSNGSSSLLEQQLRSGMVCYSSGHWRRSSTTAQPAAAQRACSRERARRQATPGRGLGRGGEPGKRRHGDARGGSSSRTCSCEGPAAALAWLGVLWTWAWRRVLEPGELVQQRPGAWRCRERCWAGAAARRWCQGATACVQECLGQGPAGPVRSGAWPGWTGGGVGSRRSGRLQRGWGRRCGSAVLGLWRALPSRQGACVHLRRHGPRPAGVGVATDGIRPVALNVGGANVQLGDVGAGLWVGGSSRRVRDTDAAFGFGLQCLIASVSARDYLVFSLTTVMQQ